MSHSAQLWIVNQYALRTDQAGGTRHHTFAHYMTDLGIETTIIAADSHYAESGMQREGMATRARVDNLEDARFLWLKARPFTGNGIGRVVSMLLFSISVVIRCWFPGRMRIPRPDVIIGSSPHLFAALAGWVLAKRHRVPFILEVRDLWPASLESLLGLKHRHPLVILLGAIELFLYRRSSLIIGLLGGMESHVSSRVGPRAKPVVWIPNGVDLRRVPEARPVRDAHDFTSVYTGAHGVANALITVLEAARILQESNSTTPHGGSFRFDFYGDGKSKPELVAYTRQHNLQSIEFHDFVPKSEVFEILSSADALLLPGLSTNLYEHGVSPNKLFDYFSAGRPVLFGLAVPNDPVSEAGAGIIVSPEDPEALAQAIESLSRMSLSDRQTMGSNGRAFVESRHNSQRLAKRYAEAIYSVINTIRLDATPSHD